MPTRSIVASLLTAALLTAGCGGGATDLTEGKSPDQVLTEAQGAAGNQERFQINVDVATTGKLSGKGVPTIVTSVLGNGVSANGLASVNGNDVLFDFEAKLAQLPDMQGNLTKVEDRLFVGVLGTDYRVDLPAEQVRQVRPSLLPSGLLTWMRAPREVGRETIDGVETVHLTGEVDLNVVSRDTLNAIAAFDDVPITEDQIRRSIPELRRALTERSVDVWIGTEDLLPRRVTAKMRFDGRVSALPELSTGSFDLDAGFSKWGEQMDITAPTTDRVLDPKNAQSVLGG